MHLSKQLKHKQQTKKKSKAIKQKPQTKHQPKKTPTYRSAFGELQIRKAG